MKEKIGLYIGRFQPFHKGHRSVVVEALTKCDKLVIAIGSSQESGTERNPFNYEFRKMIIERSMCGLEDRIVIIPLPDRVLYGDDSSWGKYVLDCVYATCGLRPTINFEGEEACRSTWFEGIDIKRVIIKRNKVPVSATQVRLALLKNETDVFYFLMPWETWTYFKRMRDIILEVKNGRKFCIEFQKCTERNDEIYCAPVYQTVVYDTKDSYEAIKRFEEEYGMDNIISFKLYINRGE